MTKTSGNPSWSHLFLQSFSRLTGGTAAASVRAVVRAPGVGVMSLVVGDGCWHGTVTSSVAVCCWKSPVYV